MVPEAMNKAMDEANKAADATEEAVKEAATRVKALGVDLVESMCRRLLELGAPGLHFYTLNTSAATTQVCTRLIEDGAISI